MPTRTNLTRVKPIADFVRGADPVPTDESPPALGAVTKSGFFIIERGLPAKFAPFNGVIQSRAGTDELHYYLAVL